MSYPSIFIEGNIKFDGLKYNRFRYIDAQCYA